MLNRVQSSPNPTEMMKTMATNIMQSNPQAAAFMNMVQNQCGSGDPKEFVLNMCRQNGIPESFPMSLASAMGIG